MKEIKQAFDDLMDIETFKSLMARFETNKKELEISRVELEALQAEHDYFMATKDSI